MVRAIALLALGVAVLTAVIVFTQRGRYHLTSYLFFVRYPILLGLLLFFFPLVAPATAPEMIENLFVVTPLQSVVLVLFACLAAWSVAYVLLLIWASTPLRSSLSYVAAPSSSPPAAEPRPGGMPPTDAGDPHAPAPASGMTAATEPAARLLEKLGDRPDGTPGDRWLLTNLKAVLALTLLLPFVYRITRHGTGSLGWQLFAIAVGGLIAFIVRELSAAFARSRWRSGSRGGEGSPGRRGGTAWLLEKLPAYGEARTRGGGALGRWGYDDWMAVHVRAARFAITALIAYGVLGGVAAIWLGQLDWIPALAYLLAAFTTFPWVLGFLSFQFDTPRIPVVPWIVVLLLALQAWSPAHHEYRLEPWPEERLGKDAVPTASEALADGWGSDSVLIVAAASGGGISAAYWTARVLTGLDSTLAAERFGERLAVVSSVSGGAVGSMYYVDGRLEGREPVRTLQAVGGTSLDAVTWGLVYPDVVRLLLGGLMGPVDRGWAQEKRWNRRFAGSDPTLSAWAARTRPGEAPVVLFNGTFQETGERLVISPVRVGNSPGAKRRDFLTSYPGADMRVVTAARLSATFPYVSPQAHPERGLAPDPIEYHVSDGGYYDNSGLLSALEVVDEWLTSGSVARTPTVDGRPDASFSGRIALIEIRAGPRDEGFSDRPPSSGNLLSSWLAPIETLFRVRGSSQVARNAEVIRLYEAVWRAQGDALRHFVFPLSSNPPLSWQLSDEERGRIAGHWPTDPSAWTGPDSAVGRVARENAATLDSLRAFLRGG